MDQTELSGHLTRQVLPLPGDNKWLCVRIEAEARLDRRKKAGEDCCTFNEEHKAMNPSL